MLPRFALIRNTARNLEPHWVFIGLTLASLMLFLLLLLAPRADGHLVGSDGTFYYVYLHSLVIDGDLSFANEYRYFGLSAAELTTPTGLAPNKYAIGPALLWLPFFLVAHAVSLLLGLEADGYSYLYQSAISVGSIVYGALGFWLAYRSARHLCSQSAALWAVVLLWLASNASYYLIFEPSMSHMVALLSVALLYHCWFSQLRHQAAPRLSAVVLMGFTAGLVLLVRLQDGIVLLVPFGSLALHALGAWRRGRSRESLAWLGAAVLAGGIALVMLLPQLWVWNVVFGSWSVSPYMSDNPQPFRWGAPQVYGVLFSSFHGLLSWHPIYAAALLGLLLLWRRDAGLASGLLLVIALQVYVVAAWWAWWQGDSFGGRMFLSLLWMWLLGLAVLLDWLRARGWLGAALVVGAVLVGWNGLALVQYRLGFVPMSEPLTWQQMTVERLRLPWLLWERLRSR